VHQYIGVAIVALMMIIYPFVQPFGKYEFDPTIWAFFRQVFAVLLLSWPIVWVEVLLK